MKTRKKLSGNGLLKGMKQSFEQVKEHRIVKVKITLADNLMSGFAMFSLKDPSLLAFDTVKPSGRSSIQLINILSIVFNPLCSRPKML